MEDTLELVLLKPVTYAKTEHTVLKLSEPTAKQMIEASKAGNELEQAAKLIHLNAAVPMGVVELLSQRDFLRGAAFFDRFWPEGPPSKSGTELPASASSTDGDQPKASA